MRAIVLLLALAAFAAAAPVPKQLKAKRPDAEVFAGKWDVVCEENGQPSSTGVWEFDTKLTVLTVAGEGWRVDRAVRYDPTTSPKQIDLDTWKGIYAIDGDDIRIAFTTGGDRPTSFDSKPGVFDNRLRRVK